MNKLLDKIIYPNKYVRITSGLYGGFIAYKNSSEDKKKFYGREVPKQVHIAPTLLWGGICSWVPIIPVLATTFALTLYSIDKYYDWENATLSKQVKE